MKKAVLERKVDWFRRICGRAGLRVTPQRIAVYKALVGSKDHPSAEVVLRQLRPRYPHISLDTVNRTLLTLVDIGAAFIVEGTGQVRRYDADMAGHQHFKCARCGKVIDLYIREFDDIVVPAAVRRRFRIFRKTVCLEGLCESCKGRASATIAR